MLEHLPKHIAPFQHPLANLFWLESRDKGISWSPSELYALAEEGAFLHMAAGNIFQDTARSIVAAAGDPVGGITDLSGNANHGSQAVSAARPTFDAANKTLTFDAVDDNIEIPLAAGVTGTIIQGSTEGIWHGEVNAGAGTWEVMNAGPAYSTTGDVLATMIIDRVLTPEEIEQAKAFMIYHGAAESGFSGTTYFDAMFRRRTDLTSISTAGWDASSAVSIRLLCERATNLTSIDLSGFAGATLDQMRDAFSRTKLVDVDLSMLDLSVLSNGQGMFLHTPTLQNITFAPGALAGSSCTVYDYAFRNCALDQTMVDYLLVEIEKAGTSNGTIHIDQGTNAVPGTAGAAAKTALESRGWTVVTNV